MSALQADPEPPPRNGSLVKDESIVCGAGGLALSLPCGSERSAVVSGSACSKRQTTPGRAKARRIVGRFGADIAGAESTRDQHGLFGHDASR